MDVISICPLRVASVRWRPTRGRAALTVIAKATYRVAPVTCTLAEEQEDPNEHENHWDDDPGRSLYSPSDLAPFKPRPEVTLVGYAFAPRGEMTSRLLARLIVGNVDKSIVVHGDRVFAQDGALRAGTRFQQMPLRYEKAAGGPSTQNPVGAPRAPDTYGAVHLPNLEPLGVNVTRPDEFIEPIGFGPVAADWPARRERLGALAGHWSAAAVRTEPLPEPFDPLYFMSAPADQHLDELRADERIVLENLHPDHPRLITSLPGSQPHAYVERPHAAAAELALTCDTLWIDTARSIATLVWRAQIWLDDPEQEGRVVVTLDAQREREPRAERPPAAWSEGAAGPTSKRAREAEDGEQTLAGAALPFRRASTVTALGGQTAGERWPSWLTNGGGPPEGGPAQRASAEIAPAAPEPRAPLPSMPMVPAAPRFGNAPPLPADARGAAALQGHPGFAQAQQPPPMPVAVEQGPKAWLGTAAPAIVRPAPVSSPGLGAPPPIRPQLASVPLSLSTPGSLGLDGGAPAKAPLLDASAAPKPAAPPLKPASGRDAASRGAAAAASDAAAAASEPAAPAGEGRAGRAPAAREPAREHVDLLWFDAVELPRIRADKVLGDPPSQRAAPVWIAGDRDAAAREPPEAKDRRDALAILIRGAPLDDAGLQQIVGAAYHDDGVFSPSLALVTGELAFTFDELETLRATITVVQPFLGQDKKLREIVAGAAEILKSEWPVTGSVAEGLTRRVEESFAQGPRAVAPGYLDGAVERILLEGRRYHRKTLLGAPRIRALLTLQGGSTASPTYLPDALAPKLPLFRRFRARAVVEVRPQEDQYETHATALLVLAIGRVLSRAT